MRESDNMMQQQKTQQAQILTQLDQSVKLDKVSEMTEDRMLQLRREELAVNRESVRVMERLGFTTIGEKDQLTPAKEEIPKLDHKIWTAEKKKKKEKNQEKDAARRARQAGMVYPDNQSEAIKQGVAEHRERAKKTALAPGWNQKGLSLSGAEFTPDPQTGAIDIGAVLQKRRILHHQAKEYQKALKQGEDIPINIAAALETNAAALKILDDAVKTYCASNGVDCDTGKSVSGLKKKAAQKHLALAMENYQECILNMKENIGRLLLDKVKEKNPNRYNWARGEMEQDLLRQASEGGTQMGFPTTYAYNEGYRDIRQMISENGEKYAANKKLVDDLYQEFLSLAKTGSALECDYEGMRNVMNHEYPQIFQKFNMNTAEGLAVNVLVHSTDKKKEELLSRVGRIQTALSYILKGKEPGSIDDIMFLEQRCGIVTERGQMFKRQEEILNGMAHNAPETDEDTADGEAVRLQYEGLRREYARLLADAEKGAANDPENQEIQSRLTKLQRIQSAPTMANILNTISGLSRDNIQRNMKVNQFMNHRYRRADGSSYKIPNSAAYRDSAQFAKPIGQTADVTQEEMYNLCDNFHILKEGKHLDGTDAGENEPKSAMARELELQRAAYREIREYTDARPEIFHNPNFSQKDFSKAADDFFLVHSKVQCMNVRGHALLSSSLFSGLSKEEQEEMKEMDAFSHGVMWFIRNIQNDVSSGFMKDEHWTDTSHTMEDRIERYRKTGK